MRDFWRVQNLNLMSFILRRSKLNWIYIKQAARSGYEIGDIYPYPTSQWQVTKYLKLLFSIIATFLWKDHANNCRIVCDVGQYFDFWKHNRTAGMPFYVSCFDNARGCFLWLIHLMPTPFNFAWHRYRKDQMQKVALLSAYTQIFQARLLPTFISI